MEKQRKCEYPDAEEVTIELKGLDPDQWDKTALRPVEVRMKKYLQGELVESGLEESVPATIILGVRDPYVTELIPMRVKDTKPSGMVQITRTTKVNVEGLPASFSLLPPK